ncbi:hypothetical protein K8T06_10075 [bacterium]|nr:hypothetical protein [bacterium]
MMHETDPRFCPDCGSETMGHDPPRKHIIPPQKQETPQDQLPQKEKELITYLKNQKRTKRGNYQGCGCLLILLSIPLFFVPPIAGIVFIVGLIILIIGFTS